MKYTNLFYTIPFIFCLLSVSSARAGDPVTITVTGNIVASPCEVDPNSAAQNIDLGDIQASTLQTAGNSSPWVPVNISLINCPAGTSSVTATFHGTPDPDGPDWDYVNTGDAKNVSVSFQSTGASYPFGNGKSTTVNINNGGATINAETRVISNKGGATPGSVKAVITVSFVYN